MASKMFVSQLPRLDKPHTFPRRLPMASIFKDAFKIRTIMVFGALAQIIISALLPSRYAVVPVAILLFTSLAKTIIQTLNPLANEFTQNVMHRRVTAQLPSRVDGSQGPVPSSQSLIVFKLGIQWNHPLGLFAPGVRETSKHFLAMAKDMEARRDEYGLLNVSEWRAQERDANNSYMFQYYFRDLAGLHKFAHDEVHMRGIRFYDVKKHAHIGIFHETFEVPVHGYEAIYANCHPVLMGKISVPVQSKQGTQWVNSLVSAATPELVSQYARMGRTSDGSIKPEYLQRLQAEAEEEKTTTEQ